MGALTVIAYVIYLGAAVLMVFAILLQEGKGGGLSALGGTQAESAFGATNPVRRMTVVLAVVFFLLAGFLSYMGSRERRERLEIGDEKPPAAETSEKTEGEAPAEEEDDPDAAAGESVEGDAAGETGPAPAAEAEAPNESEEKE